MSNMQRVSYVFAIILAVLLGVLIATTLFGNNSPSSATPSPTLRLTATPVAQASGAPLASGSIAPSTTPTPLPTEAPTPAPTPTPVPTPPPATTVTFPNLKLDAATDGAGKDRIITWATRTALPITASFTSSGGNVKACLFLGNQQTGCKTGSSGTLSTTATGNIVTMTLRLRGVDGDTPIVSATLGFVAVNPSVTIKNARFDGTAAPDTNGVQVLVMPRKAGVVKLTADWGGHPFQYEIDLIEQGGAGLKSLPAQGPATKVSQSLAIVPPNGWMLVLQNIETGFGTTWMTATVTWP
jgi:hypothetical protein